MREEIAGARRVVVKVGSSSLTTTEGGTSTRNGSASWSAYWRRRGCPGARLSWSHQAPSQPAFHRSDSRSGRASVSLATQQAAGLVGQGLLMGYYTQLFDAYGLGVGQVLLTADDVTRHSHYRNAYRFGRLLELGVVPIVNENDTVATHEIRFGDNDRLAALVAHLVHANALVLLSDVSALYTMNPANPEARKINEVWREADLAGIDIAARGTAVGTGGMITKD